VSLFTPSRASSEQAVNTIEETANSKAVVESRDNKVAFYENLLYEVAGEPVDGVTFRCIRMEKDL